MGAGVSGNQGKPSILAGAGRGRAAAKARELDQIGLSAGQGGLASDPWAKLPQSPRTPVQALGVCWVDLERRRRTLPRRLILVTLQEGLGTVGVKGHLLRTLRAAEAGPKDLLWADALLLGTPENFGYLSGALKDFLDRTFYEVEGKLSPLPYAMFVSAGNDGRGAVRAMERIANGYPFVAVQQPLIARGEPSATDLQACESLGLAMALGIEMGIF